MCLLFHLTNPFNSLFVSPLLYSDSKTQQGSFYIQIEPNITVGAEGSKEVIPLDAIRCQTVLAKCLGPLSTWESKLIVAKNSGYNVVHFTPIQVRHFFAISVLTSRDNKFHFFRNSEHPDPVTQSPTSIVSIQNFRTHHQSPMLKQCPVHRSTIWTRPSNECEPIGVSHPFVTLF